VGRWAARRLSIPGVYAWGVSKRVYAFRPDCVVIDVKMPEIDGLQLERALRGDAEMASIPLVILSALVRENDRGKGMYAGADQYIIKPTKPRELVEAIQRAIALSEDERQRRQRALAEADAQRSKNR
jgi:DNA-binding response OmpR family regulator